MFLFPCMGNAPVWEHYVEYICGLQKLRAGSAAQGMVWYGGVEPVCIDTVRRFVSALYRRCGETIYGFVVGADGGGECYMVSIGQPVARYILCPAREANVGEAHR